MRLALAAHQDFTAGRLDCAGEDLDQGRFAGTVVAKQADDLAAVGNGRYLRIPAGVDVELTLQIATPNFASGREARP